MRRILVLACGNPSRGDDAIGPEFIDRLERRLAAEPVAGLDLECLTDFQWQIEHVIDLEQRDGLVFVDAAASGPEPFAMRPVAASAPAGVSTHALSPGELLHAFESYQGRPAPRSELLAIRGHGFELGEPLTAAAERNLAAALDALLAWLRTEAAQPPSASASASSSPKNR